MSELEWENAQAILHRYSTGRAFRMHSRPRHHTARRSSAMARRRVVGGSDVTIERIGDLVDYELSALVENVRKEGLP